MLPIILIIIGALLVVAGIIGLISVYIQPLRKAIRVYYDQDLDDFWYEHGRGQKLMEEGRRILVGIFGTMIVLGMCLLIPGLVMQYMPRGNASVVAESEVGADVSHDASGDVNPMMQGDYHVVISGETVTLNGKEYASLGDFENDLKLMDRTKKVTVTDDFAVSATYHRVVELINLYGFVYGDGLE